LYSLFWVILQRLNFMCGRFGILCIFDLHRVCERDETSAHKIQTPKNEPKVRTQCMFPFRKYKFCTVDISHYRMYLRMPWKRLWKPFRPPEQCPHLYDNAKRLWMISLPGTLWGCIGSLDMPSLGSLGRI